MYPRHSTGAFNPQTVPVDPESVRRGLWAFLKARPVRVTSEGDPGHFHRAPTAPSDPGPDLDPNEDQHTVTIAALIVETPRFQYVQDRPECEVAERLYRRVYEAAWELVHAGILRPAEPRRRMMQPGDFHPAFNITQHGRSCLDAGGPNYPLDTTGQVAAFRAEFVGVPDLDLMVRYLSEAIEAYRHGMTLAGATMIGCAYELAVVQLAKAVVTKWPPDTEPALNGKLKEAAKKHVADEYAPAGILIDVCFKCLEAHRSLVGTEWQWVANCLRDTFHLVREVRNDAGHPSGRVIDRDVVFSKIINLGPTYRHVRSIIDGIA